ncbi:ATP-binding protein [Streptomyces boninensis]|uniref:ATP-binding protein n=1 Tax=Streptomyces boninensis TaxID=2039455 RepID=UPI003B221111
MSNDLGGAIDAARSRGFVGREHELAAFTSALSGETPRRVLYVHGPGGIGKTALLQQFRRQARARGRIPVAVDGRDVDCTPEGFRYALKAAEEKAGATGGRVLLLDGYEQLAAIDDWIRDELLPGLPADTVAVFLGRTPPGPSWRADPAWRELAALLPLAPLSEAESLRLLALAGVPEGLGPHLAALGKGHPLTLALLADAAGSENVPAGLADAPDLVAVLVEQLVGEAPGEAHELGRALCASAWLTTEDLLRSAVGDQAQEVWAWLEAQPYITRGADGLYPHDLVRDLLDADLRRRSPETCRRVNSIVHVHATAELRRGGSDRRLWAHQKLYMHRRGPLGRSLWALRDQGSPTVAPARPEDHRQVLEILERFEGPQSVELAARWLKAAPQHLMVVRSPAGIAGFTYELICPAGAEPPVADPVVEQVLAEAERLSPVRDGEEISITRFASGAVAHQRDAYGVLAGCVGCAMSWLTRPLAWSFCPMLDPEFWRPSFGYLALTHEFPVPLGDLEYTVFAIDWRRCPVENWLEFMAERELTGAGGPPPPEALRPPPLGRDRFAAAVRAALRDLHRPDRLGANPLTGTRLAAGGSGGVADRLRATLTAAADRLGDEPRAAAQLRALDRTFLRPAPTQEAAAELLGLPFSTYRRHLTRATERLTELLWAVETGQLRLEENATAPR